MCAIMLSRGLRQTKLDLFTASVRSTASLCKNRSAKIAMDPVAAFTTDKEKTFQHQESLPSLPIPSLEHTLNRYLDSVRPLVTDGEFASTRAVVRKFELGEGRILHEKLMDRAKHQRNWLAKWWDEKAYLEMRMPSSPLMNLAGPSPFWQTWPASEGTQIKRAALWLYFGVDFWDHIRKERVKVDRNSKGKELTMHQFRYAFNTCKIPGVKRDQLRCHFRTESEGVCPTHVVVFCKGRIFSFDTFHSTGTRLTPPEIQKQLSHIRSICDASPPGPGVGSLTGDNRTSWAQTRSRLVSYHPDNWKHLQTIETALVAVVLDEARPQNQNEVLYHTLAGDSANRWFDKSYTYIVYKNGLTAANCDHAPFEGMVLVMSTNYTNLALQQCGGEWRGSTVIREQTKPEELMFHLEESAMEAIENARRINRSLNESIEVNVGEFMDYGKSFLRGFGLHPDTHVQLAIQYAYYQTYHRPAPTYETATTRQFYNARTETLRSCTSEAVAWSKAMDDPSITVQQRHRLYMEAANRHNQLMDEAQDNRGCDRHLLGLMWVAQEEGSPIPDLYTDPAFTKSGGGGNFILSTSFLGYSSAYGCVAPMCEHGYCTAYSIQDGQLNIVVSSWVQDADTDCVRFTDTIHSCLRKMREVICSRETASRL